MPFRLRSRLGPARLGFRLDHRAPPGGRQGYGLVAGHRAGALAALFMRAADWRPDFNLGPDPLGRQSLGRGVEMVSKYPDK